MIGSLNVKLTDVDHSPIRRLHMNTATAAGCQRVTQPSAEHEPCNRVPAPRIEELASSMSILSQNCAETLSGMPLGSNIRCCFNLESTTTHLNNGSYGTAPTPVLSSQAYFVNRMEMNPDRYMRRERPDFVKRSREQLAEFLHADPSDVVLVSNATTGVNSVLRSIDLQGGDEVLCLNLAYPAILNTLRHICYYTQEVVDLNIIDIELPVPSYEYLINQVASAITPKTRLAVFDHITSSTAFVLPVKELVDVCHARGVPVLIDGAHGPGQLQLNLTDLKADFYVGNCHKWLFTSKGCAFLHVAKQYQSIIRPVVTSLAYEQGFVEEFSIQGTRDEANFFTLPTALHFYASVGQDRLFAHNTGLIEWASEYLASLWKTDVLLPQWQSAPFMRLIRLPLDFPENGKVCDLLGDVLMDKFSVNVKCVAVQEKLYVRISAQIYNDRNDYYVLGQAIEQLKNSSTLLTLSRMKIQ